MKKLLFAFVASLLLFTNCIKEDSVKFHGVEDVKISIGPTTAVNLVLSVENSSCSKIRVNDALFHITDPYGNEIATLTVIEEVALPRKSTTSVSIPVRIRLTDPLRAVSIISNIRSEAPRMLVTGSARLNAGAMRKKYEVNKMPLSRFISIFEDEVELPADLQIM